MINNFHYIQYVIQNCYFTYTHTHTHHMIVKNIVSFLNKRYGGKKKIKREI